MPCAAHSAVIARVSILMPPFATVYGAMVARAQSLVREPMLMILPRPRGIIRFAASRPMTKALVRLVSITRRQSAVSSSTIGRRNWMPALLTRMSTAMPCSSRAAKAATISASLVTSKQASCTVCPAARISDTALASRPASAPFSATAAPASARPSAIARPRPRDDPVTSAVRPVRSNSWPFMVLCLRSPYGQVGALEHRRQKLGAQARAFHREHVAVLYHRHGGDEFVVPACVKGAHTLLDQRVGLAERSMDPSDETNRADTVMRGERPMIGVSHGSDLAALGQPA